MMRWPEEMVWCQPLCSRRSSTSRGRAWPGAASATEPSGWTAGPTSKLTLISAPAGFGKTTLLAEWLAARPAARPTSGRRRGCRSTEADNDPASFWTYVIAALQTVAPGVGASALALLQAPQPPPIETVLAALLNELRRAAGRHRAGARRLPRDRRARRPGRDGVPARPSAPAAARGDRQPGRSRAAAGAAASARRAGRDPRRRAALHARRGRGVPQRDDGAAADGAGRGCAGGTHRGLDRRAPAGGALDAGARRRRRLHRRLRRR